MAIDKKTPQFLLPPYTHTLFSQRAVNSLTSFLDEGICSQREGKPGFSLEPQRANVQGEGSLHGQEQVLNLYSTVTWQQKVTHGRGQTTLTHSPRAWESIGSDTAGSPKASGGSQIHAAQKQLHAPQDNSHRKHLLPPAAL